MRPRAALTALTLALAALSLGAAGCGAMVNGTSRTVVVKSATPGAEVYINGGFAGKAPATFVTGNAAEQTVTVRADGYEDKEVALTPKVKALPIVLDILCSLTIIGVAAPISDGILGTFVALEPKDLDVVLARGDKGATPVREFAYAPGDVVITAPPPAPPQTSDAPASCKTRLDCKGGLVCPSGQCVTPACVSDKQCGPRKFCSLEGACQPVGAKK